jgi:hypothetical protein
MNVDYTSLRGSIYVAIDTLYDEALLYQKIWMRQVAKKELELASKTNSNLDDRTSYQLRIELSGASFVIRWMHIRFIKNNGKFIRLQKAVSIPRSGKYTKANFGYAAEWEIRMILELEDQLAPIRVQLKHLMKSHQSIGYASKAIGKELKATHIKERVTPADFSISKFKTKMSV